MSSTTAGRASGANRLIGYGAMQLAGPEAWGAPPDWPAAVRLLRHAYEWGVRLIDTAWYYGPHIAHELIAEALYPYPEDLVLVTKAGNSRGPARSWVPALSPSALKDACHLDLLLLRLEALPLVLLRWSPAPDDEEAFVESLGALLDLREEGYVLDIGLSNIDLRHLKLASSMMQAGAVSNAYSIDNRRNEELVRQCSAASIMFLPYYPLLSGNSLRRPALQRAARILGVTPAQVAIAWLSAQSPIMVPIPGTRHEAHLSDNIAAQRLTIPEPLLHALEEQVPDTRLS